MKRNLTCAVAAALLLAGQTFAQTCAVTIDVKDTLGFSLKQISVDRRCAEFSLTLRHIGTQPAGNMGHNWVLTRAEDFEGAVQDGQRAGFDNQFVKPGDVRVLAATRVIGGGEQTTISLDPSRLEPEGDYTYFCSFPAHFVQMQGKLLVE